VPIGVRTPHRFTVRIVKTLKYREHFWVRFAKISRGVTYVGVDIVASVIDNNQREFGNDNFSFRKFLSLEDLPPADLLVCKDVLQHLPNATVKAYLAAFRKKYKFLLITNDEEPAHLQNIDIDIGGWRTLRLDQEPFCEPSAVVLSWTVLWGKATTRKATSLLYGNSGI
jgi:hypothetical protein